MRFVREWWSFSPSYGRDTEGREGIQLAGCTPQPIHFLRRRGCKMFILSCLSENNSRAQVIKAVLSVLLLRFLLLQLYNFAQFCVEGWVLLRLVRLQYPENISQKQPHGI